MAVYADTAYYLALLIPGDELRPEATRFVREWPTLKRVTSDPVLVEVLAHMAGRGAHSRRAAIAFVDELRADPLVEIVRQTPGLFDAGLELYRRRPDKGYSLTDAMSMAICRGQGSEQVLTHDRHFA